MCCGGNISRGHWLILRSDSKTWFVGLESRIPDRIVAGTVSHSTPVLSDETAWLTQLKARQKTVEDLIPQPFLYALVFVDWFDRDVQLNII